jgi:hypothetical protein
MIFAGLRHIVLVLAVVTLCEETFAQTFTGCGTLVPGPPCPIVFQSDQGGTYTLGTYGSFQLGDHVFVAGTFALCPTVCGVTNGCILQNTITACTQGTPFCFGDGSGTACPCGNTGGPNNGCANSIVVAGARLTGSGAAIVSADSLVLTGSGMPNSSVLYFQGTTQVNAGLGVVFGDGLRCTGGSVIRLAVKANASNGSHYPAAGDALISVRGAIPPAGGTRMYQAWYRNSAGPCGSGYNLTNGLQVTWMP